MGRLSDGLWVVRRMVDGSAVGRSMGRPSDGLWVVRQTVDGSSVGRAIGRRMVHRSPVERFIGRNWTYEHGNIFFIQKSDMSNHKSCPSFDYRANN